MQAYLTWQVLRRRSGISPGQRTPTAQSRHQIRAVTAALAVETGLEITCCHFPPGTRPAPPNGQGRAPAVLPSR